MYYCVIPSLKIDFSLDTSQSPGVKVALRVYLTQVIFQLLHPNVQLELICAHIRTLHLFAGWVLKFAGFGFVLFFAECLLTGLKLEELFQDFGAWGFTAFCFPWAWT